MIDKLDNIGFYTMQEHRVRNVSMSSPMKRCEMILLEACNFRCPYCRGLAPYIYGERSKKTLTLDEVKRNIDHWCASPEGPLENIRFSGGEPTLHPNIKEIVAYAKAKGVKRIAISSNGSAKLSLYKELVELGTNDFSISLDGCCADTIEKMSGGVKCFDTIAENIRELSKLTYVTVGVVLNPENIDHTIDVVKFADSLGVSDIRLISAAQWNEPIEALSKIDPELLAKYPIMRYRAKNFREGLGVRGIADTDSGYCGLAWDDSVIAGDYHFPCVIYMREQGKPIGRVGPSMRQERKEWAENHNCHNDPVCKANCLDTCVDYNNKFRHYHSKDHLPTKKSLPVIK
jgi:MoaA/NifB/PqqE/SkfB family radical SAM enzyme